MKITFTIERPESPKITIVLLLICLFSFLSIQTVSAAEQETSSRTSTLETITVTANKTEENAQEVSNSLTVFSGDKIDELKMEGILDISMFTPNFTITESGVSFMKTPSIRGLASNSHTGTTTVGLYVDGVPTLSPVGYDNTLIDIERVEVLRGPQGTLYGKGAEAGIVNIITRAPGNEIRFPVSVDLGVDGKVKAGGTLSRPIVKDKVYISMSFLHDQRDGWVEDSSGNTVDDFEQNYGAAKLKFTPTDDLDITLSGSYLKYDNGQPHMNLTETGALAYGLTAPQDRVSNPSFDAYDKTDISCLSLTAEYLISNSIKLSSVTASRQFSNDYRFDYDFSEPELLHYIQGDEVDRLSEELRISSTGTPVTWVAGIYADTDEVAQKYTVSSTIPGTSMTVDDAINKGTSWSAFAHANVPFGNLSVIGGLRYDYQEREYDQPSYGIDLEEDWSEFSPKVGVEYRISEGIMTYATVSKGYLSGGFNAFATDPQYRSFDEEKLWSYEIGVKNTFLDNRLILNAAVFYMDITDALVFERISAGTGYTTNAAEVSSKGFEAEMVYIPVQGLTLNANFGYVEAKFDKFSDISGDYEGKSKPYAPEYTFNIGAMYRTTFGLYLGANIVGQADMYVNKENSLKQDAYQLVNTKIGYESENYDIYLYGKNIFDEKYDTPYDGDMWVVYSQPAEYGVTFAYRF